MSWAYRSRSMTKIHTPALPWIKNVRLSNQVGTSFVRAVLTWAVLKRIMALDHYQINIATFCNQFDISWVSLFIPCATFVETFT